MITSREEILNFLHQQKFAFEQFEHPAVFTCEEADAHRPQHPATSTKNLFLCDKKARRFFLAVTSCERSLQLDQLAGHLGVSHLRFASEENLMRLLGLTRGSVTMLGLVNDRAHQVELWLDSAIWQSEYFLAHPLINTATLLISKAELLRFLTLTGHQPAFFNA